MIIALCNEVIRELPFERQCALAAGLGYDGIELAPFTLGEAPHLMSASARVQARRAASDAGVKISSLHWLLVSPEGLSITSADKAVRERTVEVMRRLVGLAADLGATAMVHGSPAQRNIAAEDNAADAWARARACFAAIAPDAEQAGVTYCLEALAPFETNFLNTIAEAAKLVLEIGSPSIRTMIDCAAVGQHERQTVAAIVETWVPRGMIGHVQVNDPNERGPGQGTMRFAPILRALQEHEYGGAIAVEPFVYEPDGPTSAARAIGYIRGLLEAIESTT